MNAREAFMKISTDEGAIRFAKLVQTGRVSNPFTAQQWHSILEYQAAANHPTLSKAQAFSRYLDSEVGNAPYQASKVASAGAGSRIDRHIDFIKSADTFDREDYLQKRAELDGPASAKMHHLAVDYQRTRGNSYAHVYGHADNSALRNQVKDEHLSRTLMSVTGVAEKASSTPMCVISDSSDDAYLAGALSLESGRAGRDRAAMRLDITPRSGACEDNAQDAVGAHREAQARAARRHAANPARSFERHYSDALCEGCLHNLDR